MAGRGPRPGGCPARAGPSRPAMTRTQMLREAKTAAVVQGDARNRGVEPSARGGPCPARPRTGLARVGPPPADPKKINFACPPMTKAMQLRQKKAAELKMKYEAAEQQRREDAGRRPRRTAAPVGGDARMGCERRAAGPRKPPETPGLRKLQDAIARGHVTQRGDRPTRALNAAVSRGHITSARSGARPKAEPSGLRCPKPTATATPISEETRSFAREINAEIVQAVPISDGGQVDKIIISPGAINTDRSTIVCIVPPAEAAPDPSIIAGSSQAANRSIQVISESLDEQDAAESAAVQDKLTELQNARREFVIAVANVGSNAVNLQDDCDDSILNLDDMADALEYIPSPPRQQRIVNVPDVVSHPAFQIQYGRDHPDVVAARDFSRRTQAAMQEREGQRRMERNFERYAVEQIGDLDFNAPLEQDIQDADVSWEEDEFGELMPCPSRIKASMRIPQKMDACPAPRPTNIQDLERFFDLDRYPPTPGSPRAPPGREGLHPDLWDIEDVWYHEQPRSEGPPLMRFDDTC